MRYGYRDTKRQSGSPRLLITGVGLIRRLTQKYQDLRGSSEKITNKAGRKKAIFCMLLSTIHTEYHTLSCFLFILLIKEYLIGIKSINEKLRHVGLASGT